MHGTRNTGEARSFEDLRVWQKARELTKMVYAVTQNWHDYGLRDQVRRASVSIVSNIAEGYERESREEFVRFLYIARGSCGEVRAQLYVAFDLHFVDAVKFVQLHELADYVIRMIAKLIDSTRERKYVHRVNV